MKIIKFAKKKDGQYMLTLENDRKILLHEDLILKNDLLIKKTIDEDEILNLLSQNNNYNAYNMSIKYLSVKMRSIFEVKEYLKKKEIDQSAIDQVVDKLIYQGYLNDTEYSKAYINDRINLSNDGPYKIITYLKNNNIKQEIIDDSIKFFDKNIQIDKINNIILKQIKSNNNRGAYLLKQKILMNLITLGYEKQLIVSCLDNFEINDSEAYKKEYNKIHDKLSKKYSGKELEYKIKQKLYQKGFLNHESL